MASKTQNKKPVEEPVVDDSSSDESDFSDLDDDVEQTITTDQLNALPVVKETQTKIENKKGNNNKNGAKKKAGAQENRGVIYLGHIPYGFFEEEMKGFFSQFGSVTNLRLARNKKTGSSKHYAFVEFRSREVAKIVSETMHGYMMFGRTLVCKLIDADKVHADTFKGANKKFRKVPWQKIAKEQHNKTRTEDEEKKRVNRLLKKENKKRKLLTSLGIEYTFGGYQQELENDQESKATPSKKKQKKQTGSAKKKAKKNSKK